MYWCFFSLLFFLVTLNELNIWNAPGRPSLDHLVNSNGFKKLKIKTNKTGWFIFFMILFIFLN